MDNQPVKVQALGAELRRRLTPIYGAGEAEAMVRLIFHSLKGWTTTDLAINFDMPVSDDLIKRCDAILRRLEKHEPLQYILGEAYFYGMNLHVDPSVLIPRPETAELVDMIVRDNPGSDLKVLDIGTGSGAIAIALARNMRFPEVTAIDISPQALSTARRNAKDLKANVDFKEADVMTWTPEPHSFDIIVSNPPYIPVEEKSDMDPNVLDHEPSAALFVPDDDPLKFYRRITVMARSALRPSGRLYFEINPRFADNMRELLEKNGFTDVAITRDSQNRERFASAEKPSDD